MSKDPAVLFFINDWLTSTAEMDADIRGWYLNLLLHNYDKKDLPNDVEKLAVLCNVKFSEYERFKQVFEQVLKQKFELNENNRLSNERTNNILRSREDFKDKRSNAGKVSYVMKYMAKHYTKEYKTVALRLFLKDNFDYSIDLKNEQMLKQVFKQVFELYINENEYESNKENIVDWDALLLAFNNLTKRNFKLIPEKAKRQILARLKEGYDKADLWNAIENCYNDEYHKETNHKYLTLEFISRPDKMEKYSVDVVKEKKQKVNIEL